MLLAAFALGLWFGWLIEAFRKKYLSESYPFVQSTLSLAVLGAAFVLGALLIVYSLLARYLGILDSRALRLVDFVTAPAQLWAIIAFMAGWLGYRKRLALARFFSASSSAAPDVAPPDDVGSHGRSAPATGASTFTIIPGTARLFISGIAILIVGILYFVPDLRTRLQSLKFGEVEARFVTATQTSIRDQKFPDIGFESSTMIFGVRSTLENELKIVRNIGPKLAAGLSNSTIQPGQTDGRLTFDFYQQIAFPTADAVACYLSVYSRVKTDLRPAIANVARRWIEFSRTAVAKPPTTKPAKEEATPEFDPVRSATSDLLTAINAAVATSSGAPKSKCNKETYSLGEQSIDKKYMPELFTHGYVISFIASLAASALSNEQSVEYMNDMAPFLNAEEVELYEQLFFYMKRDEAKTLAGWYPPDHVEDLSRARELADQIIVKLRRPGSDADLQMISHISTQRASIINSELYELAHRWAEGRSFSPEEIESLEGLSKDLQIWLNAQSLTSLADKKDEPMTRWRFAVVAGAYDTIALGQFAIGDLRQDRADRCGRILHWLIKARNASERAGKLQILERSELRSVFRTLDAHDDMYRNICTR